MAIPALVWTLPVEASPATTADSHKLNNALVVVSDKFGTTGTFAPGGSNASKSGKYMVTLNDVDRVDLQQFQLLQAQLYQLFQLIPILIEGILV